MLGYVPYACNDLFVSSWDEAGFKPALAKRHGKGIFHQNHFSIGAHIEYGVCIFPADFIRIDFLNLSTQKLGRGKI